MILIVSDGGDPHSQQVVHRLREKGCDVLRVDVRELTRDAALSTWVDDTGPARRAWRRRSELLPLDDVRVVWFRRLAPVAVSATLSKEDAEFAVREATAFAYSVGASLADRFCVNPLVAALATDHGKGKVSQLEAARRVGMAVPKTLATNDPDAARAFLAKMDRGAIYKPFYPPSRNVAAEGEPPRWATVFTNQLTERALARLDGVRFAPCLFQELIEKRLELRVTVMGNKVFATEIHSQVHADARVDFRRNFALGSTPYAAHQLPARLEEQIRELQHALGLQFGAYDFILTPDGRYVFLEVNQQGQFLWLEEQTGQPLLENFCEFLRQGRPDFACEAPSHPPGPLAVVPPSDALDVVATE